MFHYIVHHVFIYTGREMTVIVLFPSSGALPACVVLCCVVFLPHQGEQVVLQAQSVHRLQAEVSDARQQTLQHGRTVLNAIEAHSAEVDL